MASHLGGAAAFSRVQSSRERFRSGEAEILRPRYVSVPERSGVACWTPRRLYRNGHRSRYKRMRGFNVLHPMGWDAFGLPAEQYAVKTGQHPAVTTRENVAKFKSQLKRIGFSYDWQREINTTDPKYYKWTQWIFLQIYNSWFNPETK